MKKIISIIMLLVFFVTGKAQKTVVSGYVTDERSGDELPLASVTADGRGVTVVTNDDGYFTLKSDEGIHSITVSHLGYESKQVNVSGRNLADLRISLRPSEIALPEVVVWTGDARDLVMTAIQKIPENYSRQPELFNCFYREVGMKRSHYIYIAEGVLDMYKTSYMKGIGHDRVAIAKGRRLLSPKEGDTLGIKVVGGPVQPIHLDVVKNVSFLLNEEQLDNYELEMEPMETIDDRLQFVVGLTPRRIMLYPLYYGKLYIDCENLAFTRAELSLDMKDKQKAAQYMLFRKPTGVRFKPRELTTLVDYKTKDGVTRIHYVRNTFRFSCDWKRRLFSSSFTAFCEMVVTDRQAEAKPVSGRDSFNQRDSFFDHVEYFLDTDFWKDYNIIEPTERLDKAVGRILKRYGER